MLTRHDIDARLLSIELEIPFLPRDVAAFYAHLEEHIRKLVLEVAPDDALYLADRFNLMVQRLTSDV